MVKFTIFRDNPYATSALPPLYWRAITGICLLLLACNLSAQPVATEPLATEMLAPEQSSQALSKAGSHVWDLTDLYPNIAAWETALSEVKDGIKQLRLCEGKVASNKKSLIRCMTRFSAVLQQLLRAYTYANLGADADLRNTDWQRRMQQTSLLYNDMQKLSGFFEPELIAKGKLIKSLARPGKPLTHYDFYFADLLRRSAHTLSAAEEAILAEAAGPMQEFSEAYSVFTNAEIPWPSIATPEGDELRLDSQGYGAARQSLDRGYRSLAFERFFGTLQQFSQTLANLLSGQIRSHVFSARSRGFGSALTARLDSDNLPEQVYRSLVAASNSTLPSLHRYFRFRQRMLGLRSLSYYDIYPPLVPALQQPFPLADGNELLLKAVIPLGSDYGRRLKKSLTKNWVHVYPQQGKRSGAYMNGSAYGVHPYLLLNYNNGFTDVSTLVHEWGHAMHSLYSNEAQPFTKADYSTFTAELAAILPQTLLLDHMINNAATPEERLFYLTEAMEDIRGTFYRQTMFAEFEQQIHEMAESGQVLDSVSLSDTYYALVRKYHGTNRSIVRIPSYIRYEWAYIPHFYYNFYVFQYATSMAAAFYLADAIRSEGQPASDRFIDILKAGGSDHPYALLKKAGIDMADIDVYRAVGKRLDHLLDLAEQTLAQMDGRDIPQITNPDN